ncbi:MAG: VOC family protein [Janthinobacterium lividum]
MRRALSLLGLSLFATSLFAQQPTRPAITGIAFFRDYSTQQAAAETFYGPTMGFPELKATANGGTLVFAINHSQWVEVLPNTPPPRANRRMAAVGFTTRDVKAMERYLNAKGVATAEPMHDGEFAVRDPEGILVYFVESPYATATGDNHLVGIAKQVSEAHELPSATSERMIHVGFIVQSADAKNPFGVGREYVSGE